MISPSLFDKFMSEEVKESPLTLLFHREKEQGQSSVRWRMCKHNPCIHASSHCPSSPLLSFGGHSEIAESHGPGGLAWLAVRNLQWEESTSQQAWEVASGGGADWATIRTNLDYIHVTSLHTHSHDLLTPVLFYHYYSMLDGTKGI